MKSLCDTQRTPFGPWYSKDIGLWCGIYVYGTFLYVRGSGIGIPRWQSYYIAIENRVATGYGTDLLRKCNGFS